MTRGWLFFSVLMQSCGEMIKEGGTHANENMLLWSFTLFHLLKTMYFIQWGEQGGLQKYSSKFQFRSDGLWNNCISSPQLTRYCDSILPSSLMPMVR